MSDVEPKALHTGVFITRAEVPLWQAERYIEGFDTYLEHVTQRADREIADSIYSAISDGRGYAVRVEVARVESDDKITIERRAAVALLDPRVAKVEEGVFRDIDKGINVERPNFKYLEIVRTSWSMRRDCWIRVS